MEWRSDSMELKEAVKIALQSLWANKLRSILTLLGVVIGIASVIMVVTLANGARRFVTDMLNDYGANVVVISKMPSGFMNAEEYLDFQKRRDVTYDDFRAVADTCKSCMSVGARRSTTGSVVQGTHSTTDTEIRGWTWTMPPLSNLNLAEGRFFSESEDDHGMRVAIIGSDIADNVLSGDPLGKEIRISGINYTVIGVGESQGKMMGSSMDNWVVIPLQTFLRTYGNNKSMAIYANSGGNGATMEAVIDEMRTIMRTRRHLPPGKPDTFNVDASDTFQNMLGSILSSFGAVVASIAAVSLVVGGIVIMNIMLVSVTERTREIGVRKALGAKRKDILLQFLIESATIASVGGVIGVAGGIGAAKLITLLVNFPSSPPLWAVAAGLFVSAGVGIFFGIYPAHKASLLDPIVALRAEL